MMSARVTMRSAAAAIVLTIAGAGAQANDFFPGSGFPSDNPFQLSQQSGDLFGQAGSATIRRSGTNVSGLESGPGGGFDVRDGTDRFLAWCLDTLKTISLASEYEVTNAPFSTGPVLTAQKKTDIKSLFDTAYDDFLDDITNTNSAAFQLALWEIVNEQETDTGGAFTYDVDDGSFVAATTGGTQTAPGIRSQAMAYLGDLGGTVTGAGGKGYNVFYLESTTGGQNLVTVAPVPLPAAGVLLLAGLGGLAASRKLRRRAIA